MSNLPDSSDAPCKYCLQGMIPDRLFNYWWHCDDSINALVSCTDRNKAQLEAVRSWDEQLRELLSHVPPSIRSGSLKGSGWTLSFEKTSMIDHCPTCESIVRDERGFGRAPCADPWHWEEVLEPPV